MCFAEGAEGIGQMWVNRLARDKRWLRSPLGLVVCTSYVFQWGYDGKQPSVVSLRTTSRLSGKQLEDDGSLVCVQSPACIGSSSVPGRR